MEEADSMKNRF